MDDKLEGAMGSAASRSNWGGTQPQTKKGKVYGLRFVVTAAMLLLVGCTPSVETTGQAGEPQETRSPDPPAATTLSTAAPTSAGIAAPELVGSYLCFGHDAGAMVAASILFLNTDGTYQELPAPGLDWSRREGEWRIEPGTDDLNFPQDDLFSAGKFDAEQRWLRITFQEGETRVNVEQGVMTCSKTNAVPQ